MILLYSLLLFSPVALSLNQDALAELARSQTVNEIIQANQRANQEELLRGACQLQIAEKQWPTTCWDWLEHGLKFNNLSDKKKQQWIKYLSGFCQHLAQQQQLSAPRLTNSKMWQKSNCAIIAKKFGLGFED